MAVGSRLPFVTGSPSSSYGCWQAALRFLLACASPAFTSEGLRAPNQTSERWYRHCSRLLGREQRHITCFASGRPQTSPLPCHASPLADKCHRPNRGSNRDPLVSLRSVAASPLAGGSVAYSSSSRASPPLAPPYGASRTATAATRTYMHCGIGHPDSEAPGMRLGPEPYLFVQAGHGGYLKSAESAGREGQRAPRACVNWW